MKNKYVSTYEREIRKVVPQTKILMKRMPERIRDQVHRKSNR